MHFWRENIDLIDSSWLVIHDLNQFDFNRPHPIRKSLIHAFGVHDVIFSGLFVFFIIGCPDWYKKKKKAVFPVPHQQRARSRGFCKLRPVADNPREANQAPSMITKQLIKHRSRQPGGIQGAGVKAKPQRQKVKCNTPGSHRILEWRSGTRLTSVAGNCSTQRVSATGEAESQGPGRGRGGRKPVLRARGLEGRGPCRKLTWCWKHELGVQGKRVMQRLTRWINHNLCLSFPKRTIDLPKMYTVNLAHGKCSRLVITNDDNDEEEKMMLPTSGTNCKSV